MGQASPSHVAVRVAATNGWPCLRIQPPPTPFPLTTRSCSSAGESVQLADDGTAARPTSVGFSVTSMALAALLRCGWMSTGEHACRPVARILWSDVQ
ncbi:hypothetical protein VPH35_082090 [Triticum aestivum]